MSKSVTVPCECCRCSPKPECPEGTFLFETGRDEDDCPIYICCENPDECSEGYQRKQIDTYEDGCPVYVCCPNPPECSSGETLVDTGEDEYGCRIYECRSTDAECCDSTGGCSGYCPGRGCTPNDGVCCDGNCISCGDCGVGGAECCNSIEIQSLFEDLSNESEMIKWDSIVAELKSSWGEDKMDGLIDVLLRFGIQKDGFWKVSVFARAYVIDCLDDVANGVDIDIAYMNHHSQWAEFATLVRSQA